MSNELNRTSRPDPKGEIKFVLPEVEKLTLDNGLNCLFVKKNRLPVVQLTLVTDAGSRLDPNEKKGLSYLTAALLDEGAGDMDALKLSSEIENLGSVLSIYSDPDSIFLSMMTLSENLDKSLEIFTTVVTSPRFEEKDFAREKRKILTRIIQSQDDPSYVASTVFEKLVYGEIPYGLPDAGTTETVERISVEDVRLFYETAVTPDSSTLIVVGSFDKDKIVDTLNRRLSVWHNYKSFAFEYTPPARRKTEVYFVHKEDAAQTEIRVGHISRGRNEKDFFARTLMNSILGGQFSSRINLNLREDKGYTYGAHSAFYYNKCGGYFQVSTAVKSENTAEALIEIIKELKGILAYVSEKELRFAKSSVIRKYPSLFETYGQIARSLANKVVHSLPDDYFDTYIGRIKHVTLEEIQEAAKENIFPDEMIILAAGDRELLVPALEKLGYGKPVELNAHGVITGQ